MPMWRSTPNSARRASAVELDAKLMPVKPMMTAMASSAYVIAKALSKIANERSRKAVLVVISMESGAGNLLRSAASTAPGSALGTSHNDASVALLSPVAAK
jgi:hypothetical protein